MSQSQRVTKQPTSHLYLVVSSGGWWAIFNAETCTQEIISKDHTEARAELRRRQNPVKEKLPYRKDLSEQVDAILDKKEAKVSGQSPETKLEAKREKRTYRLSKDRITDPAIAAVLTGVTCKNGKYYPATTRAKLTELTSGKIASRLLRQAWSAGIITGVQPRPKRKKREVPVPA